MKLQRLLLLLLECTLAGLRESKRQRSKQRNKVCVYKDALCMRNRDSDSSMKTKHSATVLRQRARDSAAGYLQHKIVSKTGFLCGQQQ